MIDNQNAQTIGHLDTPQLQVIYGGPAYEPRPDRKKLLVTYKVRYPFTEGEDTHGIDVEASHGEYLRQVADALSVALEADVTYDEVLENYHVEPQANHYILRRDEVVQAFWQGEEVKYLENIPDKIFDAIDEVELRASYWVRMEDS